MKSRESALAVRILQELEEVGAVVERAEHLMSKSQKRKDEDYLDGVALNLHGFYSGVERILENIAREVDGSVPSGPEWHRDLLFQMSAEFPEIRPAVIGRELRGCLDEYRGFRHVVRNVYTFNVVPSRLEFLVSNLRPCYELLVRDITFLCDFLMRLDDEESGWC